MHKRHSFSPWGLFRAYCPKITFGNRNSYPILLHEGIDVNSFFHPLGRFYETSIKKASISSLFHVNPLWPFLLCILFMHFQYSAPSLPRCQLYTGGGQWVFFVFWDTIVADHNHRPLRSMHQREAFAAAGLGIIKARRKTVFRAGPYYYYNVNPSM